MTRGRLGWTGTLIALVLAIGPVAGCSDDEPDPPAGKPISADAVYSDTVNGDSSVDLRAWVPGGRVRISVDVGTRTTWRGRSVTASAGMRLVSVSWDPDSGDETSQPWSGRPPRGLPATRMVLEAGGKRFPVTEALHSYDARGEAVLLLPGSETDALPEVVLEAGGRRTVAEPEAEVDLSIRPLFTATTRPRGGVEMGLHRPLKVQRAPYVAGLGWAPRGQVWVVVPQTVISWDGTGAVPSDPWPWLEPKRLSATVVAADGRAPTRSSGRDVPGAASATTAARAWLVPSGGTARLMLQVRGSGAPREGGRAVRQVGADVDVVVQPALGG